MYWAVWSFILSSLLVLISAQEVTDAKILASKFLLSNYAVEGKEFVVDYRLYNVGEKPALQVTLVDNNFPSERFEVVKGNTVISNAQCKLLAVDRLHLIF